MNIHRNVIPPKTKKNSFCAIDVELFGADKKKLHRPTTGKFACVTFCFEPGEVYVIEDETKVQEALDAVNDSVWVFHNAQFDIRHLRRWANVPKRSRLWDTMAIEKILWSGYYDSFALDDLARRYLHVVMDKSLQKAWEKAIEITPVLLEYAVQDAHNTLLVAQEQKKHVDKNDWRIWKEVDGPAMWSILDFKGFPIDVEKWKALADRNKQRQEEIDASLPSVPVKKSYDGHKYTEYKSLNPRSPKQVKEWFASKGKKLQSTDAKSLNKLLSQKTPTEEMKDIAEKVLASRKYGKRAGTYGHKFLEDHLEYEDGVPVIHCNYWVTGAETGRMSSSNPNMQNIPARDTLEFRECFIAPPGYKLIVADWSSQEPRITAFKTQDENLISIFTSGKDPYITMAYQRYGEWIEKSDSRRPEMKDVFLGLTYGLTPQGMTKQKGTPLKKAKELFQWVAQTFPKANQYMNKIAQEKTKVETIMGRKIWLNPYSYQCGNNARNGPIQGSAGDQMKLAFSQLSNIVAVVHDEMVLLVKDEIVEETATWVSLVMKEVGEKMCPGVPFKAGVTICQNWSEAK